MRLFPILCLLLFCLGVASRHQSQVQGKKKKGKKPSEGAGMNERKDFAFLLYRALASTAPGQNVFFSPISVSMSLGMLSLGTGSHTKTQILKSLGLSHQSQEGKLHKDFQEVLRSFSHLTGGLQLSLGSSLFIDPAVHVQRSFLSAMKKLYMADIFSTNFGNSERAKKQINDYVAKKTHGKIANLIGGVDSSHIMVLINYIFFKAKWKSVFSEKNTHMSDFHVSPKKTIQVPMMYKQDDYFYLFDQNMFCTVVQLLYKGNAAAVFILPNEGKMHHVEKSLDEKILQGWLKIITERKLDLYLPKFSMEGTYQLEKILPMMGIRNIFSAHANMSGISDHPNIKLSQMVHKSMVEVDESGTTASAATGGVGLSGSAPQIPLEVEFNRPFLMAIMKNKNLLFLGRVVHP